MTGGGAGGSGPGANSSTLIQAAAQDKPMQATRATKYPLHLKTVVVTLVVILANVIGNFSLTWGMRKTGPGVFDSPLGYITALFDPWVALGVCLLLLWMLSQMALLSWADLSYVLPVTAAGFVLAAIAGRLFLQERILAARWTGVALIITGA